MTDQPLFEAAFPFADDVLNLPVEDIDQTVSWYKNAFNLTEVERRETPVPQSSSNATAFKLDLPSTVAMPVTTAQLF